MFLVGRYRNTKAADARAWEYQGLFSTRDLARAACEDDGFFIFPVELDQAITTERKEIEVEYPRSQQCRSSQL